MNAITCSLYPYTLYDLIFLEIGTVESFLYRIFSVNRLNYYIWNTWIFKKGAVKLNIYKRKFQSRNCILDAWIDSESSKTFLYKICIFFIHLVEDRGTKLYCMAQNWHKKYSNQHVLINKRAFLQAVEEFRTQKLIHSSTIHWKCYVNQQSKI